MRQIKIAVAVALVALALGGCATWTADIAKLQQIYQVATTTSVPAPTAQIVVSSFEVLEAGSTEYFKYCKGSPLDSRCAAGTVATPGPLRLAIKYIRQGRQARDQIKAAGKTGEPISSAVYNLLVTTVNNLTATPASSFGAPK